jgi:hypothetical protein
VQEIDAAARGVVALLQSEDRLGDGQFVMALLGTGTAFAAVRGDSVTHLGGTPLGGGSFAGIARRVDPSLTYAAMLAAAGRGDRRRVDEMISECIRTIASVRPDGGAPREARDSRRRLSAGLLTSTGEHRQIGASRYREHPPHCAGWRLTHGNAFLESSPRWQSAEEDLHRCRASCATVRRSSRLRRRPTRQSEFRRLADGVVFPQRDRQRSSSFAITRRRQTGSTTCSFDHVLGYPSVSVSSPHDTRRSTALCCSGIWQP